MSRPCSVLAVFRADRPSDTDNGELDGNVLTRSIEVVRYTDEPLYQFGLVVYCDTRTIHRMEYDHFVDYNDAVLAAVDFLEDFARAD